MIDRQPTKPGRIKLTADPDAPGYYYMERADEPTAVGTPINKNTLFNSNNSTRFASDLPSEAFELLTKEWRVNVPASGWSADVNSEGYYTQTIAVDEMKEVFQPNFMPLYGLASDVNAVDNTFATIKRLITTNGGLIFMATEIPSGDITIRVWRV